MKKFLAITTVLCAAVGALTIGGATAQAESATERDGTVYYPTTFEAVPSFTDLKDYAVGDGKTLYLQQNCIYEYADESVTLYENSRKEITSLYFSGGEFYYGTGDGSYYALKNFNAGDNPEVKKPVENENYNLNGYFYYYNTTDGKLNVVNQSTDVNTPLDGFSNLKRYGNAIYAVKDNVLYSLDGATPTEIKVDDFEITKNIKTGGAYEALKASAPQNINFVQLNQGAYMTEVNLDKLGENSVTYETGDTVKINTTQTPSALLLYSITDGDEGLSIISVNGDCYILHPKDTSPKTAYPFVDSRFTEGTATEGYLYSAPLESKGTRIMSLPSGASVNILKEVKRLDNPELDHDFYYVEYSPDETTTVRGYVRFGLLSTFTFNENPPSATIDPDETYADMVRTVILILIVLLLLAIAAVYLIYVGTSDKRKLRMPRSDKKNDKK